MFTVKLGFGVAIKANTAMKTKPDKAKKAAYQQIARETGAPDHLKAIIVLVSNTAKKMPTTSI